MTLFAQAAEKAADAADKAKEAAPMWTQFLPLIVIVVLFYFLFIVPQRRERRTREDMMGKLKKNDRVITNAGIIATVANIKDEEVTLRIDDNSNARLTVLRSSVARILTPGEQPKEGTTPSGAGAATNIKAS